MEKIYAKMQNDIVKDNNCRYVESHTKLVQTYNVFVLSSRSPLITTNNEWH